jgi:hypothetical protein
MMEPGMKAARWAAVIVVVAVMGGSSVSAAGTTAKTAFDKALVAAQQWQRDAVPVSISALSVQPDGTAATWSYIFYSPQRKQGFTVATKEVEIVDHGEVTAYLTEEIGKEFVDSDQALTEAGKNGLSGSSDTTMSLVVMGQATDSIGPYWTVSRGFGTGDVSVVVDARSGKFSFRNEMP